MIKTYGKRAACRSACIDFRGASYDTFKTPKKAYTKTSFSKPQQLWRHLEVPLQYRSLSRVRDCSCLSFSYAYLLSEGRITLKQSFLVFVLTPKVFRQCLRVCVFSGDLFSCNSTVVKSFEVMVIDWNL